MVTPPQDPKNVTVVQVMSTTTIQALYHAATGKTENLRKFFKKNFVVKFNDISQLNAKVVQHLEHYDLVTPPSVTINITFSNKESQRLSSFERFKIFDVGKPEIVSDIVMKYEFLIRLPNTDLPQRYILNVDIDSKLPLISDDDDDPLDKFVIGNIAHIPSLTVSIDFIDYVFARNLMNTVEEWFVALETSRNSALATRLRKVNIRWPLLLELFGKLFATTFLALFAFIEGSKLKGIGSNLVPDRYICRSIQHLWIFLQIHWETPCRQDR